MTFPILASFLVRLVVLLPRIWARGVVYAVFAGLYAIASIGLWRLLRWGWFLGVLTIAASTVTGLALLPPGGQTALAVAGVVLLPLILLLYLFIVAGALGVNAPLLARGG